ncbi:hypothetical protein [Aureibacter tunicatorum]|uniref:Uncharacterized protein n=1 Tax=Aureibacter tunicatorum TaxID=866807 RepID=A0AAE3XRV2_9BACT|nr:hypothetical protein [Aureibacter tunicatorum]MDR6241445.1 hypothetical protein [Aureibacter tunicatorum]BDD06710.1 hypothetical protein AUTU_41930 [Aureibacter tunicatorum]
MIEYLLKIKSLLLFIGLLFLFAGDNKDHFLKKNLITINGKFEKKWQNKPSIRSSTLQYFKLSKYPCEFQLLADFQYLFKEESFDKIIDSGSTISFEILKSDKEKLQYDNTILLFGIAHYEDIIIDSEKAISIANNSRKSIYKTGIYTTIFSLLIIISNFIMKNYKIITPILVLYKIKYDFNKLK